MSSFPASPFSGARDRQGWLTVHTLSEFVFCPRAGLLAHEHQSLDEVDVTPLRFNLDYLPDYSVALIEEALQHRLSHLWRLGLRVAALFFTGTWLVFGAWRIAAIAVVPPLLIYGTQFADRLQDVLVLVQRRRLAREAQAREPIMESDQMQRVNWWELLRAGYESEIDELVLEDEELRLAGRPWRILKKGSLRIPVVKALTPEGRDLPVPTAQHCTRVAAYCRLLSQNVGGRTPLGIVIFGNTYEGWTVPNTDTLQAELATVVALARSHLTDETDSQRVAAPETTRICAGCPHGEPTPVADADTNRPRQGATSQKDGRLYRSDCGERFGWTPPHRAAQRLRLPGA